MLTMFYSKICYNCTVYIIARYCSSSNIVQLCKPYNYTRKRILVLATWHLLINIKPAICNLDLGLLQRYGTRAYLAVQVVLDLILLVEARFWRRCLRPEIGDIIRATQLQADQVIDFVLACRVTLDTVFGIDLVLFAGRHIADAAGVARLADLGFCRIREDRTRRTGFILIRSIYLATRGFCSLSNRLPLSYRTRTARVAPALLCAGT